MNRERLLKLIEDMSESVAQIERCQVLINQVEQDEIKSFMIFGLKQLFVEFFINVEDFTSFMLKELNEFKIGIDMRASLDILKNRGIFAEDLYYFLNQARLMRNRISHRYKEPSKEELMIFISENRKQFRDMLELLKKKANI